MTTMVTELYDALLDAGASDEKARKAAEALANYDGRFDRLERRIDALDHKIDQNAASVRADLGLLRWMVGAVFAVLIPMFLRLFLH